MIFGWGKHELRFLELIVIDHTLLLYVGLPIPIVAVSAAVSHEQYGFNDR